jgi:hypothetical protein
MLNAGRMSEGIGPLELPSNWTQLTIPEQVFVMTDLERTARGLAPFSGLAADFDADAQAGANKGEDPLPSNEMFSPVYSSSPIADETGSPFLGAASIEDPGQPNAIMATFAWVYTDGIFADGRTGDADCTQSDQTHCWGHRINILADTPAFACENSCPVGAAFSPTGFEGTLVDYTEIFPGFFGDDSDPLLFTWASEVSSLPACEQDGDTCSFSGQPLASSTGFANVPGAGATPGSGGSGSGGSGGSGGSPGSGGSGSGGFPVAPGGSSGTTGTTPKPGTPTVRITAGAIHVGRGAKIAFLVRGSLGLQGVTATATFAHRRVRLRVRRTGVHAFTVSGTLAPGRWTIRLDYRVLGGEKAAGPLRIVVTVKRPKKK